MAVSREIVDAVSHYHQTYRHPRLPPPDVSDVYALFPSESAGPGADSLQWPAPWPNGDRPGVYLIFGSDMELLYVGKASGLGRRLNTYFQYIDGARTGCRVVHPGWKRQPTYVVTVALIEPFEAPSLEEYLIAKLHPPENILWSAQRDA